MNNKSIIKLVAYILVPATLAFATFVFLQNTLRSAVNPQDTATQLIEIAPGTNLRDIGKLLQSKGIIRYAKGLSILAKLKGLNDRKFNAGEYSLSPSMTPDEVLQKLASGEVLKRRVTVPEGMSIWDIGRVVEEAGLMPKSEFDKSLADPNLLVDAHIMSSSFEGYLFPETYDFSRPIDAKHIIWRMMEKGEEHWPASYSEKAEALKLTRHDVLTLASIIEKESGNVAEQRLISSVFHNRLNQGMKLQSDPTVIYGIPNFNGNLTRSDLEDSNNRYNTYVYFGLPPGPIANPGVSAIEAALNPEQTTFLFFVADGQGSHVFAATLKEHNENVDKYQRGKSKKTDESK